MQIILPHPVTGRVTQGNARSNRVNGGFGCGRVAALTFVPALALGPVAGALP
ncbi:hypothetical protein AB0I91_40490 [Actinosynnema sp. NPDC049800]